MHRKSVFVAILALMLMITGISSAYTAEELVAGMQADKELKDYYVMKVYEDRDIAGSIWSFGTTHPTRLDDNPSRFIFQNNKLLYEETYRLWLSDQTKNLLMITEAYPVSDCVLVDGQIQVKDRSNMQQFLSPVKDYSWAVGGNMIAISSSTTGLHFVCAVVDKDGKQFLHTTASRSPEISTLHPEFEEFRSVFSLLQPPKK